MGRYILPAAMALLVAGCALAPTHDSKVAAPLAAAGQGNVDEALRALDAANKDTDKMDLLLNLERGELLRIDARYKDSQLAFEIADVKVNAWEATARSDPEKLMGQIAATFFGDTFRTFEGQDYEKVMLTTRMAMNRISLADLDNARVDVKRTHEREAVIAEFRAKELAAVEQEAKDKGIIGTAKELNGYPIETLNDPEVLQLRNGYQNALSHYLAGFVYEALNEPSLAAPGYRKAIELRPGVPVLEEGLRGLDQRTSFGRPRGVTDVLFVIETGNAPARKSQRITFPIPSRNGLIVVPLAFPVIYPNRSALIIEQIGVGDKALPTALIADFNVMARRVLKDELPGMTLRAAIRAIGKGVIQEQLNRQSPWLGLIGNVTAAVTEPNADDRMWRALPERVFLARAFLAPGTYVLRMPGLRDGEVKLTVDGRHMLVPVRVFEAKTYFAQPVHYGSAGQVAATEPVLVPVSPKPVSTAPAKSAPRSTSASGTGSAKAKKPAPSATATPPSTSPAAASSGPGTKSAPGSTQTPGDGSKAATAAASGTPAPAKKTDAPETPKAATASTSGTPADAKAKKSDGTGATKASAAATGTAPSTAKTADSAEAPRKPATTPQ